MTTGRERMAQFVAAQRDSYLRSLVERVAAIEGLWSAALAGDEPEARLKELHRIAHTIHGTAATYGFAAATTAAHALEDAVKPLVGPQVPEPASQAGIAAAIDALKASLPP